MEVMPSASCIVKSRPNRNGVLGFMPPQLEGPEAWSRSLSYEENWNKNLARSLMSPETEDTGSEPNFERTLNPSQANLYL
jgi:hypothetical protein